MARGRSLNHPPRQPYVPIADFASFLSFGMLCALGYLRCVMAALLWLVLLLPAWSLDFAITDAVLEWAEATYGKASQVRVGSWKTLMESGPKLDEHAKLEVVNAFFNQLAFVDDTVHWRQPDYWATPLEFLATGAGDCEDFSIAKYFTLLAMGVDENKLRLSYVTALQLNQAHMVVTYFATPDAVPLVLDNLDPAIKPASERPDLAPVYSFNGSGLWLARQRGQGKLAGSPDRLGRWWDLLQRLTQPPP